MKKNETLDFSQLPDRDKRKIKKYYQHQIRKHGDLPITQIRDKVTTKFNLKFTGDE